MVLLHSFHNKCLLIFVHAFILGLGCRPVACFGFLCYDDLKDARVKSHKPQGACTQVVLWLNDPPRYEDKSGAKAPRYPNIGQDCGSA